MDWMRTVGAACLSGPLFPIYKMQGKRPLRIFFLLDNYGDPDEEREKTISAAFIEANVGGSKRRKAGGGQRQ